MNVIMYLGSKCNLNCSYCHREIEQDKELNIEFIKSLNKYEYLNFLFKGGEPLLYMDTIYKIKKLCPHATFGITTNGKNLKKYVDFINNNKVCVAISYDFAENNVRNFIPDFSVGIHYSVTSVMYHGNSSPIKMAERCWEIGKENNRLIMFYPHVMHCTNERNKLLSLNKEDYDEIISDYTYALEHPENDVYLPLRMKVASAINNHYKFGDTRCMSNSVIRCDVEGNAFTCSYVRDSKIAFGNSLSEREKIISDFYPQCIKCSIYDRCGSMCVQSQQHDLECYFGRKLYSLIDKYNINCDYVRELNNKVFKISREF